MSDVIKETEALRILLNEQRLLIRELSTTGYTDSTDISKKLIELTAKNPEMQELHELILLSTSNLDTEHKAFKSDLMRIVDEIIYVSLRTIDHIEDGIRTDKSKSNLGEKIKSIIPTSGISQIVFWLVVGVLVLFSLYKIDGNAYISSIRDTKDIVNLGKSSSKDK